MSSHPKRLPPKLPLSAFTAAPPPPRRLVPTGLLDSHVHLYTKAQLDSGNSTWPLARQNVLNQPHTLEFYGQVTAATEGFIFVQAEAVHDDSDVDGSKGGWDAALDEIEEVAKAALANPTPRLLAIVPWAPIHHGPAALDLYFTRLAKLPSLVQFTAATSPSSSSPPNPLPLIKSVRYLLETSPAGFLSGPAFVAGLRHLGSLGIAFDLTLDATHQPGILQEAIETIIKVRDGQAAGEETVFIVDHFARPDLAAEPTTPPSKEQVDHINALFELALLPKVYLKLSAMLGLAEEELVRGAFGEYRGMQGGPPVLQAGGTTPSSSHFGTLKRRLLTYLEPALESFGESRILVGSDWPMFRPQTVSAGTEETRDVAEEKAAYAFGMAVYQSALVAIGLEGEALDGVFAGNARVAYGL